MAKKAAPAKKGPEVKKVKFTGFAPMSFKDFTITQKKGTGRYEVKTAKGLNVNGADKTKILTDAKLLKVSEKKAPVAEATTEAAT